MINHNLEDLFLENPWMNIQEPNYPDRAVVFYELDQERMWAAKDNEGNLIFFLQVTNNHPEETIDSLNGVQVSIRRYGNFSRMILKLIDNDLREKFSLLTKALAFKLGSETNENLFSAAKAELSEWSGFLRPTRRGLSKEELKGLWGEFYIFKEIFIAIHPLTNAIKYWIGPVGKKQDFTMENLAIETKTTVSGDNSILKISSLEQLSKITNKLFLAQVFINESNNGISISDFYNNLSELMNDDLESKIEFERKVDKFMSRASETQLNKKFNFVDMKIFEITDGFPKITREEIGNNAIVKVNYSIESNQLNEFIVEESIQDIVRNG